MARRDSGPDFVEAIARGLDVIRAFGPRRPVMSLVAVAAAAGLPRPTARRILLTLEELGYVRTDDSFSKILADAVSGLADHLDQAEQHVPKQVTDSLESAEQHVPKRFADLIDELGSRLSGDKPKVLAQRRPAVRAARPAFSRS